MLEDELEIYAAATGQEKEAVLSSIDRNARLTGQQLRRQAGQPLDELTDRELGILVLERTATAYADGFAESADVADDLIDELIEALGGR